MMVRRERSVLAISGKNIRIVETPVEQIQRIQIDRGHEIQDLLSNYRGQASDLWMKRGRLMDQITNKRF